MAADIQSQRLVSSYRPSANGDSTPYFRAMQKFDPIPAAGRTTIQFSKLHTKIGASRCYILRSLEVDAFPMLNSPGKVKYLYTSAPIKSQGKIDLLRYYRPGILL